MKIEKGKMKPLTVEQKVIRGLHTSMPKKLTLWENTIPWLTNIKIDVANPTPIDDGKERIFAKGTATVNFKRNKDNVLLKPVETKFSITVEDCVDELGLPEVKTTKFDLSAFD